MRASFHSGSDAGSDNGNDFNGGERYEYVNYPLWISILPQENVREGVTVFWPVPLKLISENAKPLFVTSEYSWQFLPDYDLPYGQMYITNPFEIAKAYKQGEYSKKVKSTVACKIEGELSGYYGNKSCGNANVILISDQYFANDLALALSGGETGDFRNLSFISDALLRLGGNESLAELKKPLSASRPVYDMMDPKNYYSRQKAVFLIVFVLVPLLIISVPVFAFLKRRRWNRI